MSSEFCLSREQMLDHVFGRVKVRKCPACDNDGRVYFDGGTGLGVGPYPPPGIPAEDVGVEPCDECNGLGYLITYNDDL